LTFRAAQKQHSDDAAMRYAATPSAPHALFLVQSTNSYRSFIQRVKSAAPLGYTTPDFPSLYWPLPIGASQSYYLYDPGDIVRFTVYWTLLLVGGIHLIVALWACIIQWHNWKLIWIAPLFFVVIGGIEALVSGAIVGGL
jgi:hypothetical protein